MIETVIELEREKNEKESDDRAFWLWIAQSIGYLHRDFHNANFAEKTQKNPALEIVPERLKKMLGMTKQETSITDNDMYKLFTS